MSAKTDIHGDLRPVDVSGHQMHFKGWLHHFHMGKVYVENEQGQLMVVDLTLFTIKFTDTEKASNG